MSHNLTWYNFTFSCCLLTKLADNQKIRQPFQQKSFEKFEDTRTKFSSVYFYNKKETESDLYPDFNLKI